jgi:hypothetical protein
MRLWLRLLLSLALSFACSSETAAPASTAGSGGGATTSGASGASSSSTTTSAGATTSAGGASTSGGAGGSADASVPDGSSGTGGSGGQGGGASDASSGTSDASAEAKQACAAFATTLCTKIQSCTSFVLGVLYGDVATCEKRIALSCVPSFAAPGTSATPAKTRACEQSIASLACDPFLKGDFGAACKTDPGTVAEGGPCGEDAQCASTFCARAPDAACGICQPLTTPGGPCVRSSCSAGMVCPAGQSMCITPVAGKVDDACTSQEQCDLAHAVGCNTTSKKCLMLTLAQAQGSCGANSIVPTSYAVCPANGTCSAAIAGRCSAAATDGAACSTADTGTHCMSPARCVASKCVVPDPSTCR